MDQLVIYSSVDNSVVNTISKETIRFSSNTNSYLFFNSTDKAVISSRFSADGLITIPVGCYSELLHDVATDKTANTLSEKILIKFGLNKTTDEAA